MKSQNKILLALASLILSGCASTQPVGGMLFSDVAGPVATTHQAKGPMTGESCATSWLGLVAFGDASIAAAAKSGGMNVVTHVDQKSSNIWFIKNTYCTVVYGFKAAPKQ